MRYQHIEKDESYPPQINSCIGDIQAFFKRNGLFPKCKDCKVDRLLNALQSALEMLRAGEKNQEKLREIHELLKNIVKED